MNANERSASLPTALPRPLLFGHGTIRDDVARGFLAGGIGHRHLFTPQTGYSFALAVIAATAAAAPPLSPIALLLASSASAIRVSTVTAARSAPAV
jgi:hypothetical protein